MLVIRQDFKFQDSRRLLNMKETIVVIGANHGGTAVLNTILDQFPGNRVVAFDRNSDISFLGCGMALWIGGQISGPEGLFYSVRRLLRKRALSFIWRQRLTELILTGRLCMPGERTERVMCRSMIN